MKINWGQVSIGVIMLLLSLVLSTVLVRHSDAIGKNSADIRVNSRDIEHLKAGALTVQEREKLCASIAVLEQSVQSLGRQVDRIEELAK